MRVRGPGGEDRTLPGTDLRRGAVAAGGRRAVLVVLLLMAGVAALGSSRDVGQSPGDASRVAGPLLDERTGELDGLRVGTSSRSVRRRLGKPLAANESKQGLPPSVDFYDVGGPTYFGSPSSLSHKPGLGGALRYAESAFFVNGARVYGFMTVAAGASTRRGVGVGDPQERVREAYPGSRCYVANEDSEYPSFPLCEVLLRPGLRLYFGAAPIKASGTWRPVTAPFALCRVSDEGLQRRESTSSEPRATQGDDDCRRRPGLGRFRCRGGS